MMKSVEMMIDLEDVIIFLLFSSGFIFFFFFVQMPIFLRFTICLGLPLAVDSRGFRLTHPHPLQING